MGEYSKDLHIKDYALDIECLNQPTLLLKYTNKASRAEKKVEYLKELRDLTKADIDRDVRTKPKNFGIDILKTKLTEAMILGEILMSPSYKEVNKKLIKANYKVKMLKNAVRCIDQRKDMLEALIKLHGQHYFAGPSVPRDLSYEVKQQHSEKSANSHVSGKIKRSKK